MNFRKAAEENKDKKPSVVNTKSGMNLKAAADAKKNKNKNSNKKSPTVEEIKNREVKPMEFSGKKDKKSKKPSFKEAFAAARKKFIAGGGKASDYTFSWEGKKYHILRGDDKGESLADKKKNLLEAIKSGKKVRGS